MNVYGLDLSLNHWGAVRLSPLGKIEVLAYQTDKRKFELSEVNPYIFEDTYLIWCCFQPINKEEDKMVAQARRLSVTSENVLTFLRLEGLDQGEDFSDINLEGYAFGLKNSRSVTQLAEIGGIVKLFILDECSTVRLRITDPVSVPMWIGNAHASKKERCQKFLESAGEQSSGLVDHLLELKTEGKKDWDGPLTDLADAWILAKILWTELRIREGNLSLKDLPEYQRRVFLRVTEANPTNLLDRPFIKL